MSEMSMIAPAASCPASPVEACAFGPSQSFADRSGKVGTVGVLRCCKCGIGITHPPLPDVAFLYEGRESQDFQPRTSGLARVIKQMAFRREARRLLDHAGGEPKRVLDFGCGSGLFTRSLGDVLHGSHVVGSDFDAEPPAELADRPYVPAAALGEQSAFDLVLAMHVVEHDDDPVALLGRIAAQARSGGTLVLEVPNIDCVWAPVFGRHWDPWYVPFHRVHFSRLSLRAAVEQAGLTIEREIDICLPSFGRSLANVLPARNNLGFLIAGIVLHPIQCLGERLSGRPWALRIVARKR